MKNPNCPIHLLNKVSNCHECGLRKRCFPLRLSEQEVNVLEAIAKRHHGYQKGDYLYRAGEYLSDLYILKSGSTKTELISESGTAQIVSFHFPGALLGLDSMSDHQALTSVIFLENCNVCAIPYTAFTTLSAQIPQLQEDIISRLSADIAHCHELMLSTNNYTAEQRVALFVLELAGHQSAHSNDMQKPAEQHLHLSMSRNDIANYLGLTAETVSRILSKFERDGWIQVESKHLKLIDYQALINTAACVACIALLATKLTT